MIQSLLASVEKQFKFLPEITSGEDERSDYSLVVTPTNGINLNQSFFIIGGCKRSPLVSEYQLSNDGRIEEIQKWELQEGRINACCINIKGKVYVMFGESCQLVEVMDLSKKNIGFIEIKEKDDKEDRNF